MMPMSLVAARDLADYYEAVVKVSKATQTLSELGHGRFISGY